MAPQPDPVSTLIAYSSIMLLVLLGLSLLWGRVSEWRAARRERRSVKHLRIEAPDIMSRPAQEPKRTGTNERTDERSPRDQLWQEFLLDKTRKRLITIMVDSDFTVSEIRGLLKGESAVIGQEIEAARQELGKAPSQPYRTPIAGRMTDPRYYQDEPDLQYEAPPG